MPSKSTTLAKPSKPAMFRRQCTPGMDLAANHIAIVGGWLAARPAGDWQGGSRTAAAVGTSAILRSLLIDLL